MAIGRIASAKPLSKDYGYSRGTPIDRYYIESFLEEHSDDIRGHVLEIGDATYSRRFGRSRVSKQDVLQLRGRAAGVTIVGDLSNPSTLPPATFDCIIITQTLHLIFDLASVARHLRQALRPGGVALVTVPGITPIDRGEWKESWYWSLTEKSLQHVLSNSFDPQKVEVSSYGNLLAATAFLHGAAVEEVGRHRLRYFDEVYPVTVAARCVA